MCRDMPFRCTAGAYINNEEPSLDELLADPLVKLLMARDGAEEATVRLLFKAAMSSPAQSKRGCGPGVLTSDAKHFRPLLRHLSPVWSDPHGAFLVWNLDRASVLSRRGRVRFQTVASVEWPR